MKKLLFSFSILAFLMISNVAFGQITTPSASPSAKVMQSVGLTDLTVEYSRPSVKGRDIFSADGLVPFGDVWRTGANAATKFSTSDDIKVGGKSLSAGDYAILTIPGATTWKVHFYSYESGNWGSYLDKEPAVVLTVKAIQGSKESKIETFLIAFDEITSNTANMYIMWDTTMVPVSITTTVDEVVMKQIDATLAGPSKGDYYTAASYYLDSGKDLNKALEWINIATEGDDAKFWQVRRKALILAELGKKKEAIEAAKQSLELATKAGNKDYIRMNEASIKEWSM